MRLRMTVVSLGLAMMCVAATSAQAAKSKKQKGPTVCEMKFNLKGWSLFYKVANGTGTITCDNGEKADVTLSSKGGGVTAGKTEIKEGLGKFSETANLDEVLGTYVASSAEAGGGKKSTSVMGMTKGDVHLAITGKGTGFQVGVAMGKFTIERK